MVLYYVLLTLHLLIQAALAYWLFRSIRRFHRVGSELSHRAYFTPIVLSVVTLLYLIVFTGPYLLDVLRVANGTFDVSPVRIERTMGPLVELEDGRLMIFNPRLYTPMEGNHYQISFLARSHYIKEFTLLR